MDVKKLKEFMDFMKENNLVELEVEEEGKKIKLTRGDLQKMIPPEANGPGLANNQTHPQPISKATREKLIEIKAPMVGTFYRAPAPDASPYVEAETKITSGDVVCVIEAMKLMNEIKSEVKGEIVDILAENGDPVEYGQTLFLVKPA